MAWTKVLLTTDVDDSPVNGASTVPISSNWAYDHLTTNGVHGASQIVAGEFYSTITPYEIRRTTSGAALQLSGENLDVDFTMGHSISGSPDPDNGFIHRYLGTGGGETGNLYQFLVMGWSATAEHVVYSIDQQATPIFDFKVTPSVNSVPLSLNTHTHAYLPLTGGTMTGEVLHETVTSGHIRKIMDSGSTYSIREAVNDGQGNFAHLINVEEDGTVIDGVDGVSKVLHMAHGRDGVVSINTGIVTDQTTGVAAVFNTGIMLDSTTQALYIGDPNNDSGYFDPVTDTGAVKIIDVTGKLYYQGTDTDSVYLGITAQASDSDALDGYDSTAFPRKAENATITGEWDFFTGGASNTISFGRNASENFTIYQTDSDLNFTHYNDETTGNHYWNFNNEQTTTGIASFRWQYGGTTISQLDKDGTLQMDGDLNVYGEANIRGFTTSFGVKSNETVGRSLVIERHVNTANGEGSARIFWAENNDSTTTSNNDAYGMSWSYMGDPTAVFPSGAIPGTAVNATWAFKLHNASVQGSNVMSGLRTNLDVAFGGSITLAGTVDGVDIASFKSSYDSHNHDSRYYTEGEVDDLLDLYAGLSHTETITGSWSFNAGIKFNNSIALDMYDGGTGYYHQDARHDVTDLAPYIHKYRIKNGGGYVTYKENWYDGSSYHLMEMNAGGLEVDGVDVMMVGDAPTSHALSSHTGTITAASISDVAPFSQSGTYMSLRAGATTAGDVGLGSVENTALSTWAGTSNITTLGTITSGNIPASRVNAGTFGSGNFTISNSSPANLYVQSTGTANYGVIRLGDTGDPSVLYLIGYGSTSSSPYRISLKSNHASGEVTINSGLGVQAVIFDSSQVADFTNTPTVGGTDVSLDGHTHDSRYYTELEVDDALNLKLNKTGGAVTGAITSTSTFDGRDVSVDGAKLDTIASGATANTGTVTSVGTSGTVSGITLTGTVTTSGTLTLGGTISISASNITDVAPFSQSGTYMSLRAGATTASDVGLSSVENTALSTWSGTTNITTVGTISNDLTVTGNWIDLDRSSGKTGFRITNGATTYSTFHVTNIGTTNSTVIGSVSNNSVIFVSNDTTAATINASQQFTFDQQVTLSKNLIVSSGGIEISANDLALVSGNITLSGGATVDGVDISAHVTDTSTHGVTGTILGTEDVDDTPVNGATTAPVSSNWAYDHENDVWAHNPTAFIIHSNSNLTASTYIGNYPLAASGNGGWTMPRSGSIVGISVRGQVTSYTSSGVGYFYARKNGVATDLFGASYTPSGTGFFGAYNTQAAGTDTFVAGDRLNIYYYKPAGTFTLDNNAISLFVIFD